MYHEKSHLSKDERLKKANKLIHLIAHSGLKFFNHELLNYGTISYFAFDDKGQLYYKDGYTKQKVFLHDWYQASGAHWLGHMGITGPKVVQALVKDLSLFIEQGVSSNGIHQSDEYSYGWPVINSAKEDPTNINGYTDAEKEAIIAFSKEIGFSCNPIIDQARCLFDDRYTLDYEEQEVVENATLLTETFLAEMYNRDATSLLDYVPYEVYDSSPGVKTYYVFEKENNHDLLLETESEEEYVNFVKSLFESLVDELTKKLEEK